MIYDNTKVQKYGKGIYTSEKIGTQYYYKVNARVYTDETKKRFWRVRFIAMFDNEDLFDWYKDENDNYPESVTADEIKAYRNEIVFSFAESLIGYNKDITTVINECNENIKRYA